MAPMKTKDFRGLNSEAQEVIRRNAVKAVESGMRQEEVAQLYGVSRIAVNKWVNRYRKHGEKSLAAKKRGRPSERKLNHKQAVKVMKLIEDKNPEQLKLPFYLWTRESVSQVIEKKFGITVSVWTVGRYLKQWGFTPQKPRKRAFEQNPEAVRIWLEEEYPRIREEAKAQKAVIFWGDEMNLRSDNVSGKTYGKRGKTPVVDITGRRFGCNMISAITNKGKMMFMIFKERFTATLFISFLRRMVRQVPEKIFLIVDGHPVHRSKKVKRWLEKNENRITIFFLPSYSPELNPDELLNQDTKSNSVGRKRAKTQSDMISNVRSFLRSKQSKPHSVKQYFQGAHVRYAAV